MKNSPVLFYREGTCALGAVISLFWLEQPFRLARLDEGDDEDADFLKLNALGQVPVFVQGGDILTENAAILNHIGARGVERGLHFAAGTREHDQLNRAIGFLASDFHKSFAGVFSPEAFVGEADEKAQEKVKQTVIAGSLREVIQHANDHLLRTTFLYDRPTVADAYLFAMSRWVDKFYDVAKDFPHLKRFEEAMLKDVAVQRALEVDAGTLKEGGQAPGFLGHVDFRATARETAALKAQADRDRGEGQYTRAS